jgi:hypothetical protein
MYAAHGANPYHKAWPVNRNVLMMSQGPEALRRFAFR